MFSIICSIFFLLFHTNTALCEAEKPAQENLATTITIPFLGSFPIDTKAIVDAGIDHVNKTTSPASIAIGPLTINNPHLVRNENAHIIFTADGALFGQKFTMRSDDVNAKTLNNFAINLKEALQIPLFPWQSIKATLFNLALGENTKTLTAQLALFNKENDTTLEYVLADDKSILQPNECSCTIELVALNKMFPFISIPLLNNVILKKLQCTGTTNEKNEQAITIAGSIDNTTLHDAIPVLDSKDPIVCTGSYHSVNGFSMQAKITQDLPIIPSHVQFKQATLDFKQKNDTTNKKDKAQRTSECTLSGSVQLDIPGCPTITCTVESQIEGKTVNLLKGTLSTSIQYQGITLENVTLLINPDGSYAELIGNARVMDDLDIEAHLKIEKNKQGSSVITFSGKVSHDKGIKPFMAIPGINEIPEIKDITLNHLFCSLNSDKQLELAGECTIFGVTSQGRIVKTLEGVVLFALPKGSVSISSLIPQLNGTPFKSLSFKSPEFVASSYDYFDKIKNIRFPSGLSLRAQTSLKGSAFGAIGKLIPDLPGTLDIIAPIKPSLQNITLGIALPPSMSIKLGTLQLESPSLNLKTFPNRIGVSLKSGFNAILPLQKTPTYFTSECEFDANVAAIGLTLKATMLGKWTINLGVIKDLTLHDVALELGASFLPEPPFVLPKTFGYAGSFDVGNKTISMATKLSTDGDLVLLGKLDGTLSFHDLAELAKSLHIPIPLDRIPQELGEIQDVLGKIASLDTTIGDIPFSKGLTFRGKARVFDVSTTLDINIDDYGIKAAGELSPITIGNVIKLRGNGIDNDKNGQGGPAFKIALTPTEQLLYFSGEAEILGATSKTYVKVSFDVIEFESSVNLVNLIDMTIKGEAKKNNGAPDFYLSGEYNNRIDLKFSREDLQRALDVMNNELTACEDRKNRRMHDLEEKIKARIDDLMEHNENYRKSVNSLKTAQDAVNSARSKVEDLDRRIHTLEGRLHVNNNSLIKLIDEYNVDTPRTDLLALLNAPIEKHMHNNQLHETLFVRNIWDQTRDFVNDRVNDTKHIVNTTSNGANNFFRNSGNTLNKFGHDSNNFFNNSGDAMKNFGNNAGNTIKDGLQAGVDKAKDIANLTSDAAEYAALKAARESANAVLIAAEKTLEGCKTAVEQFDPQIIAWRLEQGTVLAEYAAEKSSIEVAKKIVEGAIQTYPAATVLSQIYIKKITISGHLQNPFPRFHCEVRLFDKLDTSFDLDCSPQTLAKSIIDSCIPLFKKMGL